MSAKFLHVFTDENRELQKQIGCMTGIFQIFDRQHLSGHSHKRLPAGHSISTSSTLRAEQCVGSPHIILERNASKIAQDKQRISMESSRTSFSSSSYSSFSSLECTKTAQQETLSFDKALRSSPISKALNANGRPPCIVPRSLDFRDVVKGSINRDSRSLAVKTSPKEEEVKNHTVKHRDSPRPMQLSKSMDGSYVIGIVGKSREPVDFNESLRVLVKLKEAPWNFSESAETPRSSFEAKPASTSRFSYDGREASRQSLDSRENSRPPSKPQELPRLSLDSRESSSLRNSSFDSKAKSALLDRSKSCQRASKDSNPEKELDSEKRSASVVAKLMGLEAMPSLSSASQEPNSPDKGLDSSSKQRPRSSRAPQESKQDRVSRSPKSSPGWKDPGSVVKPITIPRVPIETAPWKKKKKKKKDRIHIPQRTTYPNREAQQPESVYSEIERRLKELEFRQSNKDLRALKQILDAMQAKGLLDMKKGDRSPSGEDQNLRSPSARNPKVVHPVPNSTKGSSSPRAFESPIVIMKPARSVNKLGISPSSVVPSDGLSPLHKLRNGEMMDRRKANANNRMAKECTPKSSTREISDRRATIKTEDDVSQKARSRIVQESSRPQQTARENSGNPVKTSGSLSPRLQQRKPETERRPRPPLPSPDAHRPQRTSPDRQQAEPVPPRGKLRRKPVRVQDSDERSSECSEMRNLSYYQGDTISQRSDNDTSATSQVDIEVTSADRSADTSSSFIQQDTRSPSGRAARKAAAALKQKKPSIGVCEEVPTKEISSSAPEQPSPVSVLDASFYRDDLPPSPLNKNPNAAKDDQKPPTSDERWTPSGLSSSPTSRNSRSEIDHKKLQSIENLVQKLRELTSTDDGPPNTDHIASLCGTHQNPDHRYVSEILLASGLLLKDLSSGPTGPAPIQLHPSGHPINPDLFLVLEQTRAGGWHCKPGSSPRPKADREEEKLHRRLVFDVVNEVLVRKLGLTSSGPNVERLLRSGKLTGGGFPSGQRLLKELCVEIERCRGGGRSSRVVDETKVSEEDEEALRRSEGWTDFGREVDGVVLEIERSVFKDLIDEIVSGEAMPAAVLFKSNRRGRQLFPKQAFSPK